MVKSSLASPGRYMEDVSIERGMCRSLGLKSVMERALPVVILGRRGALRALFFLSPSSCCGFECYKTPRKSCRLLVVVLRYFVVLKPSVPESLKL